MLHHFGRIGIFMIAAQALVHFAPGKQYEKYIKSLAGIILLFLFCKPFLQFFNVQPAMPEDILKRFEALVDVPDLATDDGNGVDAEVVRRVEEEVRERLNREMEGEEYLVKSVSIQFASNKEQELGLSSVKVRLAKRGGEDAEGRIGIDEIVIDSGQPPSREEFPDYRKRFAQLLEIEQDKVEVRLYGGSKKAF